MEDFYFYTVAIALIILIIMLTMIGITLSYGNETKVYPPVQYDCPDYWVQATSADSIAFAGNTRVGDSTVATDYCKFPTSNGTNKGSDDLNIVTYWSDISNSIGGNIISENVGGATTNTYYIQMKGNDVKWGNLYPGMTVRCAKQKWALDRGIVWDGVTNYNGCTVVDTATKNTKK
jgi:hypothetical protein